MTDLEMTKLCAEAMGYKPEGFLGDLLRVSYEFRNFQYRPLHDDAQALALVKRFRLDIKTYWGPGEEKNWEVRGTVAGWEVNKQKDLNRAIVECIAKIHQKYPQEAPDRARSA